MQYFGVYIDYSRSAMGHVPCGKHICLGAYDSNVEYMYASTSGHIVDCIEFI